MIKAQREREVALAFERKFPGVRFKVRAVGGRVVEVAGHGLPAYRALDFAREFGILVDSGRFPGLTRETETVFYIPFEDRGK